MECKVAIGMMHDYFDGDLTRQGTMDLKGHMSTCPACLARFEQLEKTEAMTFPPWSMPQWSRITIYSLPRS